MTEDITPVELVQPQTAELNSLNIFKGNRARKRKLHKSQRQARKQATREANALRDPIRYTDDDFRFECPKQKEKRLKRQEIK